MPSSTRTFHRSSTDAIRESRSRLPEKMLLAAILLVLAAVWLDPPGSWLAEPDEPRYAEIPREMLATGDWITPRLNGVPYFEKPPLLYWCNALSMRLFGQEPWAARLPTRIAGLATTLLVIVWLRRPGGWERGLAAGALFLASPLAFTFSRLNLTDGLLTFFFTATLFAAWRTLELRVAGRSTAWAAAVTGAMAAGGFLTKGLVALVLPGAILLLWSLATRRWRSLDSLVIGPALPLFLAISVPWFWLVEIRNRGFLHFFFIHEHFQRFATPVANRPGPIYYFVIVFVAGFLPGLAFFFSGVRGVSRKDPEAIFSLVWFGVVFAFFSLSHSKLSPYLFPAFPPAAALAVRGFERQGESRTPWRIAALIATALVITAASLPVVRQAARTEGVAVLSATGAMLLIAGSWTALRLRRRPLLALSALTLGWGGLYVTLALIWPRTALARDVHDLARIAGQTASTRGAAIVSYRTYLQGFPWELKSVIPLADHVSELESWFLPEARRQEIFWSRDDFWKRWSSMPLVVLARARDRGDFVAAAPPATVLECRGKYCLLTNGTAEPQ